MGLDDGTMSSNLLIVDPLPKLHRLYATIVQEERVRAISRGKEQQPKLVGFYAQVRGRFKGLAEMKEKMWYVQTAIEHGMKLKVVSSLYKFHVDLTNFYELDYILELASYCIVHGTPLNM
jgi:phage tail tube protein FII